MEYFHKVSRTILIAAAVLVSVLRSASGQAPPTPTGATIQYLGTLVIEFKWDPAVGDFDNYLAVYYDTNGNELGNDVIAKTETSFRYPVNDPNVVAYSFHTVKGTTRSASAALKPLPGVVYNIQLPDALLGLKQHTSVSISWANAPDPADNVGQYVISLEQPPGMLIDQAVVDAVAGASHTFEGLNVGEEYRVRLNAVLQDGVPVEINAFEDTWTVPYPPSNGILHRTSSTTGTLTWTEAQAPFDYYELVITPEGGAPRVMQLPPGSNSVMLNDLQNGVTYGYTLKTIVNTANRRIESDTADITLIEPAATSLNPSLEAVTDHGMHLTWPPSQTVGLEGYTVSILDTNGNAAIINLPPTENSFTLVGLPESMMYELVLDEVVGGVSKFTGSVTGATKTPQNVVVNEATAHTMTVTWDSALFGNAEGYLVNVISTDGTYNALIPVTPEMAAAPYTIMNLPAGLTYEVGVDTIVGGQRFEVGALAEATSTSTSIATQVVTSDLIQTAWEGIAGATYTLLLTNLGDGSTQEVMIADSATTTHAFTGLTPGQHYTIDLTAHLNDVDIPGGQVAETTIPLPPTNIQVTPTATSTLITWSPPPNTPSNIYEGYRIAYVQQDGQLVVQDLPKDQTMLTVPVVDNGQNIFVFSASGTQVSQPGYPATSYNVNLDGATSSSLQVNYDQYSGQGYHILLVGSDGSIQEEIVVNDPATLSYTFKGLQPSMAYTAVVSGIDIGGTSTSLLGSDTAQTSPAVDFDYQLLTTPVTTTTMDVGWQHNPDSGFENYLLTVTNAADNSVQTFTVPAGGNPTQLVEGLMPGTDYSVEVSGVIGGVSSVVASARQSTRPEPPALTLMEQNLDMTVGLSWFQPNAGNVDNYIIRYGPYGSTDLQEVILGPNEFTYTLPVFDQSQQHTVQILSSVGPNQELVSDIGSIAPSGGFSVVVNPDCTTNPCQNGGVCSIVPSTGYVCTCTASYTGMNCDTLLVDVVGPCVSVPCLNNAVCVELQDGTYRCDCVEGYSGINCQTDINECASSPCLNGGSCTDQIASYQCLCADGWLGRNCETPIATNDCDPIPCLNGGVCLDGDNTFTCQCAEGFVGLTCEQDSYECISLPCLNDGLCVDQVNMYTCDCLLIDYDGNNCENRVDDCNPNPCLNGICVDGVRAFTCNCAGTDFAGTLCETQIDNCATNPCTNGVCLDGVRSFTCNCVGTDFTGTLCDTQINDCLSNPCLNGGSCLDGIRSYSCDCVSGFHGMRCETDTDECISTPCENGAICQNLLNAYTCDCQPGFTGPTCSVNIDECLLNPTVLKCLNGGTCRDGVNGYTCICPNFFSGDRCEINDNQCASNPCIFGFCEDGAGRFDCLCFPGYQGVFCETNTDECLSTPCQNNGRCDDMINFYRCTCTDQFQGLHCEIPVAANTIITVMEPNRIQGTFADIITDPLARYEVTITNPQGQVIEMQSYSSTDVVNGMINFDFANLQPGTDYKVDLKVVAADGMTFNLDSLSTRTTTICNTNICLNGGTCREVSTVLGYVCDCPPGVEGATCETDINECISNPCLNNGICRNLQARYSCQCVGAWTGPFCNVPTSVNFYPGASTTESIQVIWDEPTGTNVPNYVVTLETIGGGVLTTATVPSTDIVDGLLDFTFHAPQPGTSYIARLYALTDDGTKLPLGTINTSSGSICSTGPCENGGSCLDATGSSLGYRCFCVAGYEGDNCQLDINECLSTPCKNKAQCINAVNAFSCVCTIGWMGVLCNIPSSNQFVLGEITTNTVEVHWPSVTMEGTDFVYRLEVTDPNGVSRELIIPPVPNVDPNYVYNQLITGLQPSTQYQVKLIVVVDGTEYVVGTQVPTTKSVCTNLSPCQNQGICIEDSTVLEGYTCLCPNGWAGLNCDQDFLECNSGPCQNGGRCVELFLGYTCECRPNYQGLHCQVAITNILVVTGVTPDESKLTFPPLNDPSAQLYFLTLREDATGEEQTLTLTPDQAQNGFIEQSFGNLMPLTKYTAFLSVMMDGEPTTLNLGQRDITTLDVCAFITCQNGGTCVPDNTQVVFYRCDCLPGFSGVFCAGDIDNCAALPCLNSGICTDGQGSFTCTCASGYTGQTCQIQINECASSPCLNRGQCVDRINAFECTCVAGYTGARCETDINDCLSGPCENGAFCQDDVNRYACSCLLGYRGVNCQEDIDECASNPCINNGICTDQVNRFVCNCQAGYFGTRCESDFNNCASSPCVNGGQCSDLPNSFQCICPTGYSGLRCETAPNACDSAPCLNGGACISQLRGFACICQARWQGTNCQDAISPCENQPCRNGGNCVDVVGGLYRCDCLAGYGGDICDINIQECISFPCLNNGVCMDRVNGYDCICVNDYTGTNCQTNTSPCNSNPCVNGFCLSNGAQYFCFCTTAWTGQNCNQPLDSQECASSPCFNGGTCLEQFNSYTCLCTQGHSGVNCEADVNECTRTPFLCQNGGSCVNSVGSYQCFCADGFEGTNCETQVTRCTTGYCINGGTCREGFTALSCVCLPGFHSSRCEQQVDFCQGVLCQNGGQCSSGVTAYACQCLDGFGGFNCEININDCSLNLCLNGGQCQDGVNAATCICSPGYTGNTCASNVDDCLIPDLCLNGAACIDGINGYTCQCSPGFTGDRCQVDIPECNSTPCLNNGVCIEQVNRYYCQCQAGYTGNHCQVVVNVNDCASNPCQNGGFCLDGVNSFTCQCVQGFTGTLCQINIDECASNPCFNQGRCIDNVNQFICICQGGFTGTLCSINPCDNHQCLNGAQCAALTAPANNLGYVCVCLATYTGQFCETLIDGNDCAPQNPCANSGTCIDGENTYTCSCLLGFSGRLCEINTNECASQPCRNGGACTDQINQYLCTCPAQYTGDQCQTRIFTPCQPNPCMNSGVCTILSVTQNVYTCSCLQGFTGSICQTPPQTRCEPSPCLNGGTCMPVGTTSYVCACQSEYTGQNCETVVVIDPCNSNPCQNGGRCTRGNSGSVVFYFCACFNGYTGLNCQTRPNPCNSNPCRNGGMCSLLPANNFGYFCNCINNFLGTNCETDPCVSQPCRNGGTCIKVTNVFYTCQCTLEFTGATCLTPATTPCTINPCINGGTCFVSGTNFICSCQFGYSGSTCQILNVCSPSNPCLNGGTCFKSSISDNRYSCGCQFGYTGTNCETAIPTACTNSPCLNQGVCIVTGQTTYTCNCISGYTGTICETIAACTPNPCFNGGHCSINLSNRLVPICTCPQGYTGDRCQNVVPVTNACTINPCLNGGACLIDATQLNGYRCRCLAGYIGPNCSSAVTLCVSPCSNGGSCLYDQFHAVYTCSCLPGFSGHQCQISTPCGESITLTKGQQLRLTSPNYPNNYADNLICLYNFLSSSPDRSLNFVIEDLETECSRDLLQIGQGTDPADPSSVIVRASGTGLIAPFPIDSPTAWLMFTSDYWQTEKGFSVLVEDVPLAGAVTVECQAGFCFNGGMCVLQPGEPSTLMCVCAAGYGGNNCETNVDECVSTPCQFSGDCRDVINGYICLCPAGRSGPNCETSTANPCQDDLCRNGASCFELADGSYMCDCMVGFTGRNCENTVQTSNPCMSSPCLNGGFCYNLVDQTFLCLCPQNYQGTFCETVLVLCNSSPCFNGATCDDTSGTIVCNCLDGFVGTFCETATRDCICQNGGICFGANNCICPRGFSGQFCETNINECDSSPCMNNGVCIDGEGIFICACLTGYSGVTCAVRDPNTVQQSDSTSLSSPDGNTSGSLSVGWIILIVIVGLLLILLLLFVVVRSWKKYDDRYAEDKSHILSDYADNVRYQQHREMEMGNILLPPVGSNNITHLNTREEPWPISTDEMPTSNI